MNRPSLIALCFSLCGCSTWAPRDRALGVTATLAIAADVGTTIAALEDPLAREANPLLGARPAPARVLILGGWGAIATLAIAEILPTKARPWWLVGVAVLELALVVHNTR